MRMRSIRFRLTTWYAGLLTVLLVLFGAFIYFMLERFLERNLSDTLVKEAQTIGESWIRDANRTGPGYVAAEIEEHFAPSITGRFVRITRGADGTEVYHSGAPESGAFDPKQIAPRRFNASQSLQEQHLPSNKDLLIFSLPFTDRAGNQYLIETGAPYDQVEHVLRSLLISFGIAFPLFVGAAIGGGYVLMRNALRAPRLTAELRETIGSALEEVERLSSIVEQLLEMSRLEAGEMLVERTRFDFAEMTRATVDQMRLLAEEKNLQLRFESTKPLDIEGDPLRLKQIVVNLVDNAIKYTPSGGSVSVSTFLQDGKVVLEVADTGIGVPKDATSQIFNRFFRVDKARSRQLGGAGLGLAIVKSICTAYNGNVSVKSAEGTGAVFRVELPLEKKS